MPDDPVAPLAPIPPQGSFLNGILVVGIGPEFEPLWDVCVPPRPIFFNGLTVGSHDPLTFINKGPTADPPWTVPSGPCDRGNPTGSSNIMLNGFMLGDNGTILEITPPRGEVGEDAPPTAPEWDGQMDETAYLTMCEAYLNDEGIDPTTAAQMCADAWAAAQQQAHSAQPRSAPSPLRPPSRTRPKPKTRPKK